MLKIVERVKLKSRTPEGTVRVLHGGLRIDKKIIEEELRVLPITASRDTLYLNLATEDGAYWINITDAKTSANSVRISYIRQKQKSSKEMYAYFIARYVKKARQLDGVSLELGIYTCLAVKEQDGRRYRKLTFAHK
jgi:hypothetical protein